MAFGKSQETAVIQRDGFDIDTRDGRLAVIAFEKELEPYLSEKRNVMGRVLSGFELYLHDKGLFCHSARYPEGAVRDLAGYREAEAKHEALGKLQDRRGWATERDREGTESLDANGYQ